MARSSAEVVVSQRRVQRDLSEVPTTPLARPVVSREEAYDAPRRALLHRPPSLLRGVWKAVTGSHRAPVAVDLLSEDTARDVFVAPPWRWSDWSFAILAGVGGVLTTFAVFVLMSTKQLGPAPTPVHALAAKRPAVATPIATPPVEQTVSGTALTAPEATALDATSEPARKARSATAVRERRKERRAKRP